MGASQGIRGPLFAQSTPEQLQIGVNCSSGACRPPSGDKYLNGGNRCGEIMKVMTDLRDVRSVPSGYMLGLSGKVASMADAVLVVQALELPVHTYILAANSPVFADMLEATQNEARAAAPQEATTLHRIALEGDSLPVVCTALKYLYSGRYVVSPSKPAIQSCEDAAALVTFAHKYGMTQLVTQAEGYLIEAACKDKGKSLFSDPTQLVVWVTLSERCKLTAFWHMQSTS